MRVPISVIIAVYNTQAFLAQAIESILGQSWPDFELILIDDKSTDRSLAIIDGYRRKDARVTLLSNPTNLGLTRSLNRGLAAAKGDYVAILDSDDLAHRQRLERQYRFLETHPDYFLVGSRAAMVDVAGRRINVPTIISSEQGICRRLPKGCCFFHSSVMFRRRPQVSYREKFYYAQDYDLYLNLMTQGLRMVNLPEVLVDYRLRPDAISFRQRARQDLFAAAARGHFQERRRHGHDSYDGFDPSLILKMDIDACNDKSILRSQIHAGINIGQVQATLTLMKRYFQTHGYLHYYLFYYVYHHVRLAARKRAGGRTG